MLRPPPEKDMPRPPPAEKPDRPCASADLGIEKRAGPQRESWQTAIVRAKLNKLIMVSYS